MSTSPSSIEGYSEEHLLRTAEGVVEKKTRDSIVLDRDAEARIPKFNLSGTYLYSKAEEMLVET